MLAIFLHIFYFDRLILFVNVLSIKKLKDLAKNRVEKNFSILFSAKSMCF